MASSRNQEPSRTGAAEPHDCLNMTSEPGSPTLGNNPNSREDNLESSREEIKAIVSRMRDAFGTALHAMEDDGLIGQYTESGRRDSDEPVVCTIYDGCKDESGDSPRESHKTPVRLAPPYLREAILRMDLCDFVIETFLERLETELSPLCAHVDWIIVIPTRRVIIHFADQDTDPALHSVFVITDKYNKQYVADFTMEQFGHDSENGAWFMQRHEYMDNFAEGGFWQRGNMDAILECGRSSSDFIDELEEKIDEILRREE